MIDRRALGGTINMLILVLVGGSTTRRLNTDPPRLYTPRGYFRDPRGTSPRAKGAQ